MTAPIIYEIPVADITIDKDNVRHSGADTDLEELAASIKKHGLLQPILLRGEHGEPPYKVIVGQRRFLAHKEILRAKTIQAMFAGRLNHTEAAMRSLAENMCRAVLSYRDAAEAITTLYRHFGRDARRVSKETGLSLKKVNQYIYIEERASAKMKGLLREGRLSLADAKRAIRAASENIDKADQLIDLMLKYALPGAAKKRMVEYGQENPSASVDTIIKKATEPVVERQFFVRLSDGARTALLKAATDLSMEPDEVATKAVEEWLSTQGFMR